MGLTLIKALTASSGSTTSLTFHHGINDVVFDSTYNEYQFHFVNIHPSDAGASGQLLFQVNASGGSGFNENITSTAFRAYHQEDGSDSGVGYRSGEDQKNADAAYEIVIEGISNADDTGGSGMLTIYDPSSAYVKHFMSVTNTTLTAGTKQDIHAGYINTTSAIDEIDFKISSGTMDDGTIYMYGVS